MSSGQLRKALGNDSGDQKGGHERQHSKGAGRDGSKGARGGKSKEQSKKGKGKSKFKGDAAPAANDEDRLDMEALPTAAHRHLSRPRWCSDFLKGCCTKDPCPYPPPPSLGNSRSRYKRKGRCVQGSGRSENGLSWSWKERDRELTQTCWLVS